MTKATQVMGWAGRSGLSLAVAGLLVGAGATAAFASGSYPTLAASNIRSGPGTNYPVVASAAKGSQVTIDCYVSGQSVSGTTIWDHVAGSGYISDALVKTGSDGPVVPLCGATQPDHTYPTITAANVRSAAGTGSSIVTTLPAGAQVTIDCYVSGQSISGTTIWDHRAAGGYISDSLLRTGSSSPVVPTCSGPAPDPMADVYARDWVAANWATQNYTANWGPILFWADDCTYFVSTALQASGLAATPAWTSNSSDKSQLASTHFANPGPTKAFAGAQNFVEYMTGGDHPYAKKIPVAWTDNTAGHAVPGDVIAYDWDGDGVVDHLAMVSSVNSAGYPSVVQKSPSVVRFWSWSTENSEWIQQFYPHSKVYLIHFVR